MDDFEIYDLGIWHPLALPADKQNREGYQMLDGVAYPSNIDRRRRQEALTAVQSFNDELGDLVHCDRLTMGGALHIQLQLSLPRGAAVAPIASAIAQSAQQHGLVCYDPQSDTLALPHPLAGPAGPSPPPAVPDEPAVDVTFGPWTLRAYVETTRRYYGKIQESGSVACGCDNCGNFALARNRAYPQETLSLFESLGIDFGKESEVHYYGRTPAGLHTYRGWFYLAGTLEGGPAERLYHPMGPGFKVGFGKKVEYGFADWETVLIDARFADGPCVEIDFYVDLPWLSNKPEPEEQ